MSTRAVLKVFTLVLAAGLIPACGSGNQKQNPPVLVAAVPSFDAAGVPHFPLMVLEFDRALDPATVNTTNIELFLTNPATGIHTVPFGGGTTVTYLPGTFQVLVENNANFAVNTEYAVVVFPGLLSAEGVAIQAFATGSIALRFEVGNSGNIERPAFTVPVQVAGGAPGEIFWQWSQAQEGAPPVNITATYQLFRSTTSGGQDLFVVDQTPTTFPNFTTTGLTLNTQYFFRMIVRDNQGNVLVTPQFTGTSNP